MNLQKSTLYKYARLLADCKRARLTGTRGADEIYNLQILDCLESVKYLPESGNIIDVGTGGGLPGIIWAMARPDLSVVLLDSINKKCEAVQEIINALEIHNVKIICSRSEDFARIDSNRESFALAGAKALASSGVTAELLSPLVKVGGHVITFKGGKVHDEISEVNNSWLRLGLSKPEINFYGDNDSSKCLVIWEKIKSCPKEFPRRTGLASSKKFWE